MPIKDIQEMQERGSVQLTAPVCDRLLRENACDYDQCGEARTVWWQLPGIYGLEKARVIGACANEMDCGVIVGIAANVYRGSKACDPIGWWP
jgi:hypothetical protein